jgi:ATP-dependent Clp protease ATP-binding subunit ClpC
MKDKVLGELKNTFRPEFLNRIDAVVVFHALNRQHVRAIVDLMLNRVRILLTEQRIKLEVGDEAKDFIAEKGFDPQFGARPLRRVIQNMIEDELAEGVLDGRYRFDDVVSAQIEDGQLKLKAKERAAEPPAEPSPEPTHSSSSA